ncbi:MAG TPA: heat-inducible transcriptional repressor HrcA [Longimicrobiales bacterium]|nr:heat-inducible transcriptional repressor HrcA [Longimicrobiales bacterium]
MNGVPLNEREQRILEAVIRTYVETAEPAGSRTVAKRFGLGVSAATIRNAMADLEEKGFLYHPHTSAGRIPTDLAYRYYVDILMQPVRLSTAEQRLLRRQLADEVSGPIESVIRRAAQVLGLLTGELGVAIAPRLEDVLLEKLELVPISSEKVLMVVTLQRGNVRAVYVDLPISAPNQTLHAVSIILNERLAGQTLATLRATLPERLRDASFNDSSTQLLNIFVQAAEHALDGRKTAEDGVHLGRTSVIANQPEFSSEDRLKGLIELTEQRELLGDILNAREHERAPIITIGSENADPRLSNFTLVTSEYRLGNVAGVLGVLGPTRMPYEKVAAIVEHASRLMTELTSITAQPKDVTLH